MRSTNIAPGVVVVPLNLPGPEYEGLTPTYDFKELIGAGGFGEVWRTRSRGTGDWHGSAATGTAGGEGGQKKTHRGPPPVVCRDPDREPLPSADGHFFSGRMLGSSLRTSSAFASVSSPFLKAKFFLTVLLTYRST